MLIKLNQMLIGVGEAAVSVLALKMVNFQNTHIHIQ
jgi:hypothetical protein